MKFRNDINGLRALAIIFVILFHFEPAILTGGFIGVDVFFVISGYLMTRIILQSLKMSTFSFGRFYLSRANRIIPPLLFLCFFVFLFCYFILIPNEFYSLSKNIISSLTFSSNILYWMETGYFSQAAKENWLLHTWSLSVEWAYFNVL